MPDSDLGNTRSLLELAFPDSCLAVSVADAVKLLLEKGILANNYKGKLVWTAEITTLATSQKTNGKRPEYHLKNFLNDIGTVLLGSILGHEPRRWSTVATTVPLPGGPANCKTNLVLTSEPENKDISWENVHSTLRLKYKDSSTSCSGNAAYLSSDAFMAFSSQNTRRLFLGTSICGYIVRIYVYHRSGRVSSIPFNIHDDPHSLVHLLIGLMMCPTNILGLDASFVWAGSYFLVTIKGVVYRLLEWVFRSETIMGRGTTCWRGVEHDKPDGLEYAIKDTWTDISRTPEAELMEILKDVDGIPTLIASEKLKHDDGRDVTSYFQKNVEEKKTKRKGRNKKPKRIAEDRQHWLIVTSPFAQPLPTFSSKKELLSALVDVIRAHKGMLLENVLHRDISLDNIMIYRPADTKTINQDPKSAEEPKNSPSSGLKKGLLIDVNYGVVLSNDSGGKTAMGHRIGTLPFMAIEILKGETPGDGAYHDLESMFYVLVWICVFYRGPNNSPRFRLLDKQTANWTGIKNIEMYTIALTKCAIFKIAKDFEKCIKANAATYFKDLIPCLQELRPLLFDDASPATHDKMTEILERHRNELPEVDDWVDDEKPIPTKKHRRKVSAKRAPIKRMRTCESCQRTCSLSQGMSTMKFTQSTGSQGETDDSSDEDVDNEEEEEDTGSEESDNEGS